MSVEGSRDGLYPAITARHAEVLPLLADDLTEREIAAELGVSLHGVRSRTTWGYFTSVGDVEVEHSVAKSLCNWTSISMNAWIGGAIQYQSSNNAYLIGAQTPCP